MKGIAAALAGLVLAVGIGALPAAAGTHDTLTWNDYPTACLSCHSKQANDMFGSTHYRWVGASPDMVNRPDLEQGKLTNAVNSYCINILGDWPICGKCHTGRGKRPDDPTAGLENIDCLACHSADYAKVRTRLADGSMGPPAGTPQATLDGYVKNLGKPNRAACLECHAKAGGGDAVKRGDLSMATITNSDRNFDVHMNTSSASGNLSCQACHKFVNHKVIGKGSDLNHTDDLTRGSEIKCTTCHAANPHGSTYDPNVPPTTITNAYILDRHANENVTCQVCHIPTYAKVATETHRDWTHHHDGSVADGSTGPGHPHLEKGANLTPVYKWWNRKSDNYLLGDNAYLIYDAAKGTYPTSRPLGGFMDGKIYPFKYKTANQPMITADGKLVALNTLIYLGTTGNVTEAVESGLVNMGYPATEPYQWVTTDTHQLLNHGVNPKGGALKCADCHSMSGETTTTRMPFAELGYHTWPAKVKNCDLCHVPESMPWKEFHEYHADNMGKDCKGCHTTEPKGWIEPVTSNGLCNNCHSASKASKYFNGGWSSSERGQKLHMEHAENKHGPYSTLTTCTDCHKF